MSSAATFSLEQIRTASPCPMRWSDMAGDDTTRFCRHCNLHVYNLSNMTRADAEALVMTTEGRMCASYWRRADGTVITTDCPVGAATVRAKHVRRLRGIAAIVGLVVGGLGSWAFGVSRWDRTRTWLTETEPFQTIGEWLGAPSPPSRFLMGSLF